MFLDTSIIIEIFRSKKNSKRFEKIFQFIENDQLFISIIQLGEISDWCLKNNINPLNRISKLKDIVNITPLDEDICMEGSRIKFEMRKSGASNFSLIDGMVLASSISILQQLLTTDSDFHKAEDAILIE